MDKWIIFCPGEEDAINSFPILDAQCVDGSPADISDIPGLLHKESSRNTEGKWISDVMQNMI